MQLVYMKLETRALICQNQYPELADFKWRNVTNWDFTKGFRVFMVCTARNSEDATYVFLTICSMRFLQITYIYRVSYNILQYVPAGSCRIAGPDLHSDIAASAVKTPCTAGRTSVPGAPIGPPGAVTPCGWVFFHGHGGIPNSWMIFLMENPNLIAGWLGPRGTMTYETSISACNPRRSCCMVSAPLSLHMVFHHFLPPYEGQRPVSQWVRGMTIQKIPLNFCEESSRLLYPLTSTFSWANKASARALLELL